MNVKDIEKLAVTGPLAVEYGGKMIAARLDTIEQRREPGGTNATKLVFVAVDRREADGTVFRFAVTPDEVEGSYTEFEELVRAKAKQDEIDRLKRDKLAALQNKLAKVLAGLAGTKVRGPGDYTAAAGSVSMTYGHEIKIGKEAFEPLLEALKRLEVADAHAEITGGIAEYLEEERVANSG